MFVLLILVELLSITDLNFAFIKWQQNTKNRFNYYVMYNDGELKLS
jgi:uncharacterized membrane protein